MIRKEVESKRGAIIPINKVVVASVRCVTVRGQSFV